MNRAEFAATFALPLLLGALAFLPMPDAGAAGGFARRIATWGCQVGGFQTGGPAAQSPVTGNAP